jgi:hypothetical protein
MFLLKKAISKKQSFFNKNIRCHARGHFLIAFLKYI